MSGSIEYFWVQSEDKYKFLRTGSAGAGGRGADAMVGSTTIKREDSPTPT